LNILGVLKAEYYFHFSVVFAKLRKANINSVMYVHLSVCPYVCPSVRQHGTTRLPLDGFSLNLILEYF